MDVNRETYSIPLVLARELYEAAMNGYCKAANVRRHADWTWNNLDEFKQAAWIALAEHVRVAWTNELGAGEK